MTIHGDKIAWLRIRLDRLTGVVVVATLTSPFLLDRLAGVGVVITTFASPSPPSYFDTRKQRHKCNLIGKKKMSLS
ncbi:hypothetical protein TorRG33x02_231310 [Trema orientale]|uniref:Uncharacterized protein n=1 Tax=Trema orientale TaxID=63057 RepID=A0A2P5E6I7_TREOI|nr:hypothetical protein TorRG33x02_231310 [Trema orientale]